MSRIHAEDFSAGQRAARDALIDWYRNGGREFRIHGFAGTGKTSIVRSVIDELGVSPVYLGPTNRAARMLRDAGCAPATTIHRAIYSAPTQRTEDDGTQALDWQLKASAISAPLLVVDEGSMVGATLYRDLLRAVPRARIIAMGDPMQLPPVKESVSPFMDRADVQLTEVHRQTVDSPILAAANCLRDVRIPLGEIVAWMRDAFSPWRWPFATDQTIAWTNEYRWQLINSGRTLQGKQPGVPEVGDRVIALDNDHTHGMATNDQAAVAGVRERRDEIGLVLTVEGRREPAVVNVPRAAFQSYQGEQSTRDLVRRERAAREPIHNAYTFADVVSCHKAQGGQWPRVTIAQLPGMRDTHEQRRWLYTAVTRAQETLVLGRAT